MGTAKIKRLNHMYISDSAKKHLGLINKALDHGLPFPGLYVITFAGNEIDQLAIMDTKYLLKRRVRERLPEVVALAMGRQDAFELVRKMAEDSFRRSGGCDLRDHLLSMQNEPERSGMGE
uniref:hypothetical protein n=1 Tax=Eubacterium cellulosolvens TaxID=29322 RepID=UPI00048277C5|nr:hypothetical protein [[Eubacterium] cellulosolvens]